MISFFFSSRRDSSWEGEGKRRVGLFMPRSSKWEFPESTFPPPEGRVVSSVNNLPVQEDVRELWSNSGITLNSTQEN